MIIVRITTDDGITGYGEAPTTLMAMPVFHSVREVMRSFVGRDVHDINSNVLNFYRNSFYLSRSMEATSALSAIEIASWDIIGKIHGTPIYGMLGGRVRQEARAYSNGWYSDCVTPEDFVLKAKIQKGKGFDAIKFDPFGNSFDAIGKESLDRAESVVRSLREEFGDSMDLLIEFHGRFSFDAARKACERLDPYECMFFEEPLHPELEMRLAELRSRISTPIALGERVLNARDFMRNMVEGKVDIIQGDLTNSRGIMESFKIAAIADSWGLPMAFHNAFGPVQTAATLNLDMSINNFLIQESFEESWPQWKKKLIKSGYTLERGKFKLAGKPGLGIEIDQSSLESHQVEEMEPFDPDSPPWVVSGTYIGVDNGSK